MSDELLVLRLIHSRLFNKIYRDSNLNGSSQFIEKVLTRLIINDEKEGLEI
jgi:hypothetical protein